MKIRWICAPLISLVVVPPNLALQMNKDTSCDHYLDTAGMNSVCHNPCAGCCMPLTPSSQSNFQWSGPADSPANPVEQIRVVAPTKLPQCSGQCWLSSSSLLLLQEPAPQWCFPGPGEEQCSLMQSVLVSVVQWCFSLTSVFRDSLK